MAWTRTLVLFFLVSVDISETNIFKQSGGIKHLSKKSLFKSKFYKNSDTTIAKNLNFGDKISLYMKLCICIFGVTTRGGVLEDVLGLEDTFWSPWPRSFRPSKIALSSARGQHYFMNRWNFVGKCQKPRGKFANTFFVFRDWSIGLVKRGSIQLKFHQWQKCDKKAYCFFSFSFLVALFASPVANNNIEDLWPRDPLKSIL